MERKGQAIGAGLFSTMDYVQEQEDALWTAWTEEDRQAFQRALRLTVQQVEVRKADSPELNVSIPYQLGRLDGYTELFERLLRAEERANAILDETALQTDKGRLVLQTLYQEDGLRHGELAAAVNSPYNSLTGIMKKILASGAVESVRSGRNTRYHLTEAGRQYCERQLYGQNKLFDLMREAARIGAGEALQAGAPPRGIEIGKPFIPVVNEETYDPVVPEMVLTIGEKVYVTLSGSIENNEEAAYAASLPALACL